MKERILKRDFTRIDDWALGLDKTKVRAYKSCYVLGNLSFKRWFLFLLHFALENILTETAWNQKQEIHGSSPCPREPSKSATLSEIVTTGLNCFQSEIRNIGKCRKAVGTCGSRCKTTELDLLSWIEAHSMFIPNM